MFVGDSFLLISGSNLRMAFATECSLRLSRNNNLVIRQQMRHWVSDLNDKTITRFRFPNIGDESSDRTTDATSLFSTQNSRSRTNAEQNVRTTYTNDVHIQCNY
eukprot:5166610-Pleurochrysis_carterae.AAC.3